MIRTKKSNCCKAELVIINGNILTMDKENTRANSMAIKQGKIIAVGEYSDIEKYIGDETQVLDAKGYTVLPGFIDSHIHMVALGFSLGYIDLRDASSISEIKERVKKRINEVGEGRWILGRGWDQEKLVDGRYPSRWDLDEVSRKNPVFLVRVCGHIAVANSLALELAGINKNTKDPPGGIIDRDESGEPTGVLRESALELIRKAIPPPSEEDYIQAGEKGMMECLKNGVTCVHLVSATPMEFKALQEMKRRGMLKIRVRIFFDKDYLDELIKLGLEKGYGDEWIRINGIKLFIDGSLGGRTAALREDYNDMPGNKGKIVLDYDKLKNYILRAAKNNLQTAIHGIGDKGIELILKAYEEVLKVTKSTDVRWRIEHASIVPRDLVKKMARLNILAAVQPRFIISDFWSVDRLGRKRAKYTYNFKTMMKEGIVLGGGSDAPVDPVNPIYSVYAAVTRGKYENIELYKYTINERLSLLEALKMYTYNSAYLGFDEDVLGSIEEGKLADIIILDKNLEETPIQEIKDCRVLVTIVNGEIVYRKRL